MDPNARFDHYFTFEEMESFLKAMAPVSGSGPAILHREERRGRDIWVSPIGQDNRQS